MSDHPNRLPKGFTASGVYCGVKEDTSKLDLSLLASDRDAVGVGVYTQNLVQAAPVVLDRERTPGESFRAVVVNSGVANACTGAQGKQDAENMATLTGEALSVDPAGVLVMSTGVIGEHLPMDKIASGITAAAEGLGDCEESLEASARGIMTTDTVTKVRTRTVEIGGRTVTVTGVAKGAAMIGPNMATMLATVLTDAPVAAADAQAALSDAVVESFNCISVDGHTSTNDTVLLLANGAAGGEPLAGQMAMRIRRRRPDAHIFAFSGALDVEALKRLINAGCDGVCEKERPETWREALEIMRRTLDERAAKHRRNKRAFGGVRHAAGSIHELLQDWNERTADAQEGPPASSSKESSS